MNSNIYNFFLHITVTELCWDLHSQGSRLLELAVVIQLLRCYLTLWPWTMACQSSLSFMSPGVCSNLCPLNWWCYSTTSSSVTPFSCPQSFPASGSFPKSWLLASALVLPVNIQGWFPLGLRWFDLLTVQGALKSLLQHHGSKASILWCSAFLMVQFSHPYMTTGKTIALTRWILVGKLMSLLFTTLSRFVLAILPRSKCL